MFGRRALALAFALLLPVLGAATGCRDPEGGGVALPGGGCPPTPPHLVIGTEALAPDPIVDGDTLRLASGLRLRVRGLDTEEVFRSNALRDEARRDFPAYARARQGDAPRPRKYPTPAGEAASEALRRRLAGVTHVRLERDEIDESPVDTHGRLLAHVVLLEESGETLLAAWTIREGHSPYFVKYGRSQRFDALLRDAETLAREAERGIWGTSGPAHYTDYDARLEWWHERAGQKARWRIEPPSLARVELARPAEHARLAGLVGQEATVFGLLAATKTEGTPRICWMRTASDERDLAIVMFEESVWDTLDHDRLATHFFRVTGKVSLYQKRPQIVVDRVEQVDTR